MGKREYNIKELTADEVREAEKMWVKDAQMTLKEDAKFQKVEESLNVVEQDNVLVCKGSVTSKFTIAKYEVLLQNYDLDTG
eukprot:gene17129-biopygen14745